MARSAAEYERRGEDALRVQDLPKAKEMVLNKRNCMFEFGMGTGKGEKYKMG
jgi:hypothetical protein